MGTSRWTDALLDKMAHEGDPRAEAIYLEILADGHAGQINQLFKQLSRNDTVPPANACGAFVRYFDATDDLAADADMDRIQRGEVAFMRRGLLGVIVLLHKSLPTGYAMPCLTEILSMTEQLQKRPYHRLLGVAQLMLDVCTPGGFTRGGDAVITGQKVRLMHAGVRAIATRRLPDYASRFGVAVSQQDLLATLIGFSWVVIEGWRQLGVDASSQEEEDYVYLWNQYGRVMGIKPEYLPEDVADAQAFFEAYERRNTRPAAVNKNGVALAQANLSMLQTVLSKYVGEHFGGLAPQVYMNFLMGAARCENLGIPVLEGHDLLKTLLDRAPPDLFGGLPVLGTIQRDVHERVSRWIVQALIDENYDGHPSYWLPTSLDSLRALAATDQVEAPAAKTA